jgi:hypothetical protein
MCVARLPAVSLASQQRRQLALFGHLSDDIRATDELAAHIQLQAATWHTEAGVDQQCDDDVTA